MMSKNGTHWDVLAHHKGKDYVKAETPVSPHDPNTNHDDDDADIAVASTSAQYIRGKCSIERIQSRHAVHSTNSTIENRMRQYTIRVPLYHSDNK